MKQIKLTEYEKNVLHTLLTTYFIYEKRFKYKFFNQRIKDKFLRTVINLKEKLK